MRNIDCIYLRYDGDSYYCSELDSTYEKTLSNMNYQNCSDCDYKVSQEEDIFDYDYDCEEDNFYCDIECYEE